MKVKSAIQAEIDRKLAEVALKLEEKAKLERKLAEEAKAAELRAIEEIARKKRLELLDNALLSLKGAINLRKSDVLEAAIENALKIGLESEFVQKATELNQKLIAAKEYSNHLSVELDVLEENSSAGIFEENLTTLNNMVANKERVCFFPTRLSSCLMCFDIYL